MIRRILLGARIALICTCLTMGARYTARAAGTASGTSIDNQATVSYKVNSIDQTPVNSNVASFVVDDKVNLTVAKISDADITPG